MNKSQVSAKFLLDKLLGFVSKLKRYSVAGLVVFVLALYGFVIFRINMLSNEQPSADAVANQVEAAQVPYIDENVVNQLQSLEDNSVSVQTLFNEARSNPFDE